jgi:hypothetical protein
MDSFTIKQINQNSKCISNFSKKIQKIQKQLRNISSFNQSLVDQLVTSSNHTTTVSPIIFSSSTSNGNKCSSQLFHIQTEFFGDDSTNRTLNRSLSKTINDNLTLDSLPFPLSGSIEILTSQTITVDIRSGGGGGASASISGPSSSSVILYYDDHQLLSGDFYFFVKVDMFNAVNITLPMRKEITDILNAINSNTYNPRGYIEFLNTTQNDPNSSDYPLFGFVIDSSTIITFDNFNQVITIGGDISNTRSYNFDPMFDFTVSEPFHLHIFTFSLNSFHSGGGGGSGETLSDTIVVKPGAGGAGGIGDIVTDPNNAQPAQPGQSSFVLHFDLNNDLIGTYTNSPGLPGRRQNGGDGKSGGGSGGAAGNDGILPPSTLNPGIPGSGDSPSQNGSPASSNKNDPLQGTIGGRGGTSTKNNISGKGGTSGTSGLSAGGGAGGGVHGGNGTTDGANGESADNKFTSGSGGAGGSASLNGTTLGNGGNGNRGFVKINWMVDSGNLPELFV